MAFLTGLVALLGGGLGVVVLIVQSVDTSGVSEWITLECAAVAGLGAMLGLVVMVWATILMTHRRPEAVGAFILGVAGIGIAVAALIAGLALS